ncbi:VWA domain-containing protein [Arenicella chitinivorans]|uniref:VWA domain-containing protein n=1 Tax=Arenicella chitinivorans TaxID=1329800 RepID=A0A918RS36_9GAMM|nr:VWA domain-containing protein [Arenicella chitinivorans]GHA10806.1 VWA domain-containing protein [Arenicella chitinivorans]
MLLNFFDTLRRQGLPVTIRELSDLITALEHRIVFADMEKFYYLARTCMVKDEKHFDKFDRAFKVHFTELEKIDDLIEALIPEDWLRSEFLKNLSDEEKAQIESLGGLEELIDTFKKRLEEQKERHEGGSKWIGTGGTSPFGNSGYNPEGIRVGGQGGGRSAVKVWDRRDFKDLDDSIELGTRNIKMALRRLRKFARTGAQDELDLDDTIRSTAHNAGLLDIKMVPERHNSVKVLLLFDVGGSMDPYVRTCEELFSAARVEFKHMEYYYFHNFIYDGLWQNSALRYDEVTPTHDVLRKYGSDYKVIFVGDAAMATYEITHSGGSIDFMNREPGSNWLKRFTDTYDKAVWLNPTPEAYWEHTHSTQIIRKLMEDRMYPLTLKGMEEAMAYLSR